MSPSLDSVRFQLEKLEQWMDRIANQNSALIQSVHQGHRTGAVNLLQYLALRDKDIRDLQDNLHILGLSSLASSESHIQRQLQAILQRLGKQYKPGELNACDYRLSRKEIFRQSKQLFGIKRDDSIPHIMVTFDSSFAQNYPFIKQLLLNGMNVARINCAHDDESIWSIMIRTLQKACRNTGLSCKIYMDLPGPKIRTQLLKKGSRDGRVNVEEGQLVWLADDGLGFNKKDIVIGTGEHGIISDLKKGDHVLMDDGLIRGKIVKKSKAYAILRISRISSSKKRIKAEKGLNFPDSRLRLPALTEFDKSCIPFISKHADLIGYSFVRHPKDLTLLQELLKTYKKQPPAILLKIETPEAVKNLPALLFQGMREKSFGVMIARGDLAVEIGFERMSEIQEEILWICEAGHVPVVWATQVLENLNKTGLATRSEITDAARAALAECVMINKGDHTLEVIQTLQDIFTRIGGHHIKKRYTFRPLSIASNFIRSR